MKPQGSDLRYQVTREVPTLNDHVHRSGSFRISRRLSTASDVGKQTHFSRSRSESTSDGIVEPIPYSLRVEFPR